MRIGGIDGMRAMVAVWVMLAHLANPALPEFFRYVFTGVPAITGFFVISGFCIHYPYVGKPLPVGAFLAARAIRILLPVMVAYAAARALDIRSFNFVDGFILWSVVCELWYYALYPLFLWLSRRVSFRLQWAASMVVALVFVGFAGTDSYGNVHVHGPWLNWIVGLPSWLIGCVLAEEFSGKSKLPVWSWRVLVIATASAITWLTFNTFFGNYLTLNFFALLVALWMKAEINAATAETLLDQVGKWSYSIYLVHIVAAVALHGAGVPGLALLPLTFVSCYLFYWLIERPAHLFAQRTFRQLKNR